MRLQINYTPKVIANWITNLNKLGPGFNWSVPFSVTEIYLGQLNWYQMKPVQLGSTEILTWARYAQKLKIEGSLSDNFL